MKNLMLSTMALASIFTLFSFWTSASEKVNKTTVKKKVLVIGIEPTLIDFSSPEYAAFPGLTSEKVNAGIKAQQAKLIELGYDVDLCMIDFGQTAITVINEKLKKNNYDGILIGAGIRIPATNFLLFEKIINTVHEGATKAKIVFNTNPKDTLEAVQRWLVITPIKGKART